MFPYSRGKVASDFFSVIIDSVDTVRFFEKEVITYDQYKSDIADLC